MDGPRDLAALDASAAVEVRSGLSRLGNPPALQSAGGDDHARRIGERAGRQFEPQKAGGIEPTRQVEATHRRASETEAAVVGLVAYKDDRFMTKGLRAVETHTHQGAAKAELAMALRHRQRAEQQGGRAARLYMPEAKSANERFTIRSDERKTTRSHTALAQTLASLFEARGPEGGVEQMLTRTNVSSALIAQKDAGFFNDKRKHRRGHARSSKQGHASLLRRRDDPRTPKGPFGTRADETSPRKRRGETLRRLTRQIT